MNYKTFEELCDAAVVYTESTLDSDEYVIEGVNRDREAKLKEIVKRSTEKIKNAKKMIKEKDYDGAEAELDIVDEVISGLKDYIDSEDNISSDAVKGIFYYSWIKLVKTLFYSLLTLAPIVGVPIALITAISEDITFIIGICEEIKDAQKSGFDSRSINLCRVRAKGILKKMQDTVTKIRKNIQVMKNNDAGKNEVKESATDVKLAIYESAVAGEISEEERDLLLSMI